MILNLNNNSKPIPNYIEKYIISKINILPPQSYSVLSENEIEYILKKTIDKFPEYSLIINKDLILSIRSSFMKNYMIINHKNIINNSTNIINDYNNNINIIDLTKKYDISPLNLIRFIFNKLYSKKLTFLIKNNNILNTYDLKQLNLAICNDTFALINHSSILKQSIKYEKYIEKFLIDNNIIFKTQEQLSEEQSKIYGKPINTPDFLIITDLYVDKIKINWIDAKNFYGANIQFIKRSITKQIYKYIKNYGSGCIIFNLSFNEKLSFENVILLDNNFITNKST